MDLISLIDEDLSVYKFRIKQIPIWLTIRFFLAEQLHKREYNTTDYYQKGTFETLPLKKKIKYLIYSLLRNPFVASPKEIAIFSNSRYAIKDDKYTFNYLYCDIVKKYPTNLIEKSYYYSYGLPRLEHNLYFFDFVNFLRKQLGKLIKLNEKEIGTINDFLNYLNNKYGIEFLDPNFIKYIAKSIKAKFIIYKLLLKKINPKVLILENAHYGWEIPLIIIARKLNIPILEYQHGYIGVDHIAYNYPNKIFHIIKSFLPDYFLTWGVYWSNNIKTPSNIVVIGHFYLWRTYQEIKNIKKERIILVASSGTVPNLYNEFVPIMKKLLKNYQIVFKPHPLELPVVKTRYENLIRNGIKILLNINVYKEILPKIEGMLSFERTTLLFESIQYNAKPILIDPFNLYKHLNLPFLTIDIKEISKIAILLNSYQYKTEKAYIWAPNPLKNFSNFLKSLKIF